MPVGGNCCHAPARGSLQVTLLNQERLQNVLDGIALFPDGSRQIVDANRAAAVKLIAEIEQQHARVHGFLKDSVVTAVTDDQVSIAVSGVFVRLLDQPDERALIENALSRFTNRQFSVRFVEASPAVQSGPRDPEPTLDHAALMEELKRTFNATEEPN